MLGAILAGGTQILSPEVFPKPSQGCFVMILINCGLHKFQRILNSSEDWIALYHFDIVSIFMFDIMETVFPPWFWHPFKYHRFVLLRPYLCSNALQARLCCSHSCHSPPLSFSVGLSQNQGVFSRTGGKVGKQHTLYSIETRATWYQRFTCSSLFFSKRREFPGLLHTKKIVQVVLVPHGLAEIRMS